MRTQDVNSIHLKVEEVFPFVIKNANGIEDTNGIIIKWNSDIGFGEYTIRSVPASWDPNVRTWIADSEGMDSIEDNGFGRKLLELWMNQVLVLD